MRNSSLVEEFGVDNNRALSNLPKLWDCLLYTSLSIFLSACGDDDTPVPVTVKTVLMYLVGDNDISNDPVSYTHLDVYKRQLLTRKPWMTLCK